MYMYLSISLSLYIYIYIYIYTHYTYTHDVFLKEADDGCKQTCVHNARVMYACTKHIIQSISGTLPS